MTFKLSEIWNLSDFVARTGCLQTGNIVFFSEYLSTRFRPVGAAGVVDVILQGHEGITCCLYGCTGSVHADTCVLSSLFHSHSFCKIWFLHLRHRPARLIT